MAKIKKETTARVDCVITEIFKDEEAAAAGTDAETTEVKVVEIKIQIIFLVNLIIRFIQIFT